MKISNRKVWVFIPVLVMVAGTVLAQNPNKPAKAEEKKGPVNSDIAIWEKLKESRKQYQRSLLELRDYYNAISDFERAKWAEDELLQLHRITKFAYRLDLDVPVPTLQPKLNQRGANELFRDAMGYKDKGFGNDYIDNQRRAEILFQQLLERYPESDKIADAAYQLGDIYEKYRPTAQPRRAAMYFERCFQWNKTTNLDARLRAAHLYDKVLNDRTKAAELYREVANHDTDPAHVKEAERRLADFAGKRN
ncbi:tetratricopeptide repeat protein [Telmatocola sphagniphila]|uniref:Tetratricopeptide repeat protein n=1 Tax=Telmatocola sphagniphila TaxID=1123043 RepID=A0A8E6B8W8_9BACT|nr:tetratricopeptide repeat protein [Telmatocola sphagniphila]QVL33291.1 tetratricopeptide repeat protein [Telmatocola sphagniphila]